MRSHPRQPGPRQAGPRHAWRSLARAVSWHRRKLAVVAAVLAVLTGINAAAPRPPDTVTVLRATELLPGGSPVTEGQVRASPVAAGSVPDDALTDPDQVVGRLVVAPVPAGQVLTGYDLLGEQSVGPGRVLAPVRLADSGLAAVLRPGDRVDVLAADGQGGPVRTVVERARIVTIPAAGDVSRDTGGVLLLVEADAETAAELARAAGSSTLTVLLR
ncbi:SAF domain-containing protein [Microlunatus parietis]|uniref:Flp pilus assembly protein CpaB n=1 Tax=Microlunatus parietis TaxID=682979 RepID=A0A7Y9IBL9_9ACTN|nr:SAF domain-containing protein [Microlunatus parietis]NYE73596.1 Flp pilus assembly protein CpaB [Microlunatus parietis]